MKVVKIPSSQGGLGKTIGAELAPDAVVKQTKDLFMSEDGVLPNLDVEEMEVIPGNIDDTNDSIYTKSLSVLKDDVQPLFLGGDLLR